MGFEPEEMVFFDDGAANVEEARTVGMQNVLVRSIEDVRQALADLGFELDP